MARPRRPPMIDYIVLGIITAGLLAVVIDLFL
jgi:hypothetical protein